VAILKHGSIKNSDYGEAQRYLLFEHDSETMKLLRDEHGSMILRKGLIQTGFDCDHFTFNTECTELNRQMQKNLARNDIKAHQYIISFDPRDPADNGLTAQRAHALGCQFAQHFFEGHQMLVVTHPDGHNHTGNLHCHIVFNSLRKRNVEWKDFMERPVDALAGYKHHQTRALLRHMQIWLTEACEREKLYTVDFTLPAEKKISDREYRAKLRGQKELDALNREIVADGLTPSRTDYVTIKQQIRDTVDELITEADSFDDLAQKLKEKHGIQVKISRGACSFLHPDREKPIRGKSLGRNYERDVIENRIYGREISQEQNRPEYAALPRIFLIHSDLRLVVDVQNCVKAQQSRAYARKVVISNLQQKARSLAYIQNHGIGTMEKLKAACTEAEEQYNAARTALQETQRELREVNEQIHHLGTYLSTKNTYSEFLKSPDKAAFRTAHAEEINRYERARELLKAAYPNEDFPSMKALKTKKDRLQQLQTRKRSELKPVSSQRKTLQIVQKNINAIFENTKPITRKPLDTTLE